jgi:transposase
MDLKDEQWEIIKPLLPKLARRADGRGRPRVNDREILNGILWILRTGARWLDLPERYPPYQTCHRRFQEWRSSGVFEQLLRTLVKDVKERGKLDLTECFIDGSFVVAKKGAAGWERPSGAKVQSSWQWQMALVFLSPYPLKVLRRMKSDWSKGLSKVGLRKRNRND